MSSRAYVWYEVYSSPYPLLHHAFLGDSYPIQRYYTRKVPLQYIPVSCTEYRGIVTSLGSNDNISTIEHRPELESP